MLIIILASLLTVAGVRFITGFSPATRTAALNRLNMFSASAGVLTRVLTAVDALRVVVEWSDAFPRDMHGRQLHNQRIPRSPLQVPAPVGTAPAGAPRFQQAPEVVKSGVAMTEMSKVAL